MPFGVPVGWGQREGIVMMCRFCGVDTSTEINAIDIEYAYLLCHWRT